jgi:hypothetical protein
VTTALPARLDEHLARQIPRGCKCTWQLRLGDYESSWTRTETDPACKLHGQSSSDERWTL